MLDPLKIGKYSLQDQFACSLSVLCSQPINGILVVFALIATIYTMTCWYDVAWNITALFFNWDKVILRKRMPQSLWSTAVCASIVEVLKTFQPMFFSEFGGKVMLSGSSHLRFLLYAIRMTAISRLFIPSDKFTILLSPSIVIVSSMLWIESAAATVSCVSLFVMASLICAIPIWMFFSKFPLINTVFERIFLSVFSYSRSNTVKAKGMYAPETAFFLYEPCSRFPFVALFAYPTNWRRLVDHLAPRLVLVRQDVYGSGR